MKRAIIGISIALSSACSTTNNEPAHANSPARDARQRFGDTVSSMLLDTTVHELRAQLFVKIPNPNRDDESPLSDSAVLSTTNTNDPGPHTMDGKLYASLPVLRELLGKAETVSVDSVRGHVFVGAPPVLLTGHMHGDVMYVPVKLFARQFGAYTDIGCTLANCAFIWRRPVIDMMVKAGAIGGAGILEGHAEGIVTGIDVTKRPTG
jgi:hypothetical protein